jgi:hypothetical protein
MVKFIFKEDTGDPQEMVLDFISSGGYTAEKDVLGYCSDGRWKGPKHIAVEDRQADAVRMVLAKREIRFREEKVESRFQLIPQNLSAGK